MADQPDPTQFPLATDALGAQIEAEVPASGLAALQAAMGAAGIDVKAKRHLGIAALAGYAHEYTRHGTTTLFAALEVATGWIRTGHFNRRRRREFLQFMNEIVAEHPDEQLHVILDNLNTHKPKQDRWLAQHKNVHFHYTPTHASWLNQIEIWFSLLTRYALRPQSFTHPRQVRQAIDAYTEVSNEHAAPFEWTKRFVAQKPLQKHYANLRK